MNPIVRRREFNRFPFDKPIHSILELVTLSYIHGNSVETKDIYVVNMSAGGLRFISKGDYPVNYLAVYKVKIEINGIELVLFGKIIRKSKFVDNFFDYGFKFDFNYSDNQKIISNNNKND